MQSAESIRRHDAVASFTTSKEADVCGLTDPVAIAACRPFIEGLVSIAQTRLDQHIQQVVQSGKNPYCDEIKMGSEQLRFAARVPLFSPGELRNQVIYTFERLPNVTAPQVPRVLCAVWELLGERIKPFGYELCGKQVSNDGSDLLEVAVRDPLYVAEAINRRAREVKVLSDEAKHGGMGITAVARAEQVTALRGLVEEFCNTSVATITEYFERFAASGATPFNGTLVSLSSGYAKVPGRRVQSGDYGDWAPNGVEVRLEQKRDIKRRLNQLTIGGLEVDHTTFFTQLRVALARRLADLPALPAVAVGEKIEGAGDTVFVAVCVAKPRRSLSHFLRDLLRLPKLSRRALPAPLKQLPAPAAQVVPPVNFPTASARSEAVS